MSFRVIRKKKEGGIEAKVLPRAIESPGMKGIREAGLSKEEKTAKKLPGSSPSKKAWKGNLIKSRTS